MDLGTGELLGVGQRAGADEAAQVEDPARRALLRRQRRPAAQQVGNHGLTPVIVAGAGAVEQVGVRRLGVDRALAHVVVADLRVVTAGQRVVVHGGLVAGQFEAGIELEGAAIAGPRPAGVDQRRQLPVHGLAHVAPEQVLPDLHHRQPVLVQRFLLHAPAQGLALPVGERARRPRMPSSGRATVRADLLAAGREAGLHPAVQGEDEALPRPLVVVRVDEPGFHGWILGGGSGRINRLIMFRLYP